MDWEFKLKLIKSIKFFNEINLKANIGKWYDAKGSIKKFFYKNKIYNFIEYEPLAIK